MFYGKNGAKEEKSQWKNIIDVTKRHFQNEKNNTIELKEKISKK